MPDFVHSTLLAWVESDAPFAKLGADFAERLHDYHRQVSEQDLFVVPALSTPQNDRSVGPAAQAQPLLHLGVVERSADGLRLRGARMISSLSPLADELLVYSPPMLRPGDEDHAAVFALPLDTPGLKLICRPPFGPGGRDPAEHPVAARFEEPDAMVIFEDVLVPWERVFLDGSVELSNGVHRQTIMRELVTQQFGVRRLVRLELVTGAAIRVARTIKVDGFPQVQERLGYAAAAIEQARALLAVAEADCSTTPSGTRYPKLGPMTALRLLLAQSYPSAVELLRDLGAGGLLMRPSPSDLDGPAADEVARYYQGAGVAAAERVRLFNLAWDLTGDAFGQRGVLFERFGGGDPMRVAAGGYLGYDPSSCFALVDRALGSS
jgi:anthranilate 3-monooxygenase (FAD) / 4-hydroxyphenylacetate 3-monooxygenase